jgi:hypothetical protein
MPKFMLLYRGPMPDMANVDPAMGKAVMDEWNAWFGKIGKAMQDGGTPLMPGGNVSGNGAGAKPADVNGYSIIEAKDLAAAKAMLKGHPHLKDPKNSVDVLEMTPIPGT